MKYVVFHGGLGNQIFQYCLYCKLKEQGHNVKGIIYTNNDHNGFEIDKYFNTDIRFENGLISWLFKKILIKFFRHSIRTIIKDEKHRKSNMLSLIYYGYWQDKKYFPQVKCISFKHLKLNERNIVLLEKIQKENSVSIHVRRGDYLNSRNLSIFGNVCTAEYYEKAISEIESKFDEPFYFVFSNDIEWCKKSLNLNNVLYVDWNLGNDSIYDMYLMSKCKVQIIANSTFSYWAASLGDSQCVIYPKRWYNSGLPRPNIFLDEWIGL